MIQRVVDRSSGEPVTSLTLDDFNVLENDTPIAEREAFLDLEPIDQIPYQLKTVLMLDVSSSVTSSDLVDVKAAAEKIVDNLIQNQQIAVYVFDDTVRRVSDFSSDKEALKAAIDGITGGGPSTNLYGAVVNGFSQWNNSFTLDQVTHGALILITDGNDTASSSTLDAALAAKGDKDFFALTVGSEIDPDPLVQIVLGEKLDTIADSDRALASKRLFSVSNYGEVDTGLQQIAAEVERLTQGLYFLYYATPKRSGIHTVTVSIENNAPCSELDVNCVTSLSGNFSASGFSNVLPELLFSGPEGTLRPGNTYQLSGRVRWSNPPYEFTWALENLDGQMTLEVNPEDPSKATLSIASSAQVSKGSVTLSVLLQGGSGDELVNTVDYEAGISVSGPDGTILDTIQLRGGQSLALTADVACDQCSWWLDDSAVANLSVTTGNRVNLYAGSSTGYTKLTIQDQLSGVSSSYAVEVGFRPGTSEDVQISYDGTHSLALKADGSLWAWGWNINGSLGTGDTSSVYVPTRVGAGSDWVSTAAGSHASFAIKSDGTLWAWGQNGAYQLGTGDENLVEQHLPVQVGEDSDWVKVFAGAQRGFAIKSDGSLWGWGHNQYGRLGTGTDSPGFAETPVQIGTDKDWASVRAGRYHTMALKTDGSLWAWGHNNVGQLGTGNSDPQYSPVQVGEESDWSVVDAGNSHTVALKSDGSLWTWGDNGNYQLGSADNTLDLNVPTQVGSDTDWTSVDAGSHHTLAVKSGGSLWAWGRNVDGQAGIDSTDNYAITPTQVGAAYNWTGVVAGTNTSFAVSRDGYLWGWGDNEYYRLGVGSVSDKRAPVVVGF